MFNTLVKAKAKIVKNKKLQTLRLVVAFNVYEKTVKGEYKFPSAKNCAYVSGDLDAKDLLAAVATAQQAVRAEIEFV